MKHANEVAQDEKKRVKGDPISELEYAKDKVLESSKLASVRLREIWNPETRKYEPREEMIVLHGIINANLGALYGIEDALRALRKEES